MPANVPLGTRERGADLETLRRWLGTASPPRSIRERIGPFEVWLCAILAATLVTYGEIRCRLTGRQRWRVLTVAGVFIWLGLLALTCPQHSWPFAVVKSKQTGLRTGNSELYEFVPEGTLPVGSEVTIHGRRGGWARVQTMDGRRGWIADVDLLVDEASQNEINAGNR
ncbi:MAG: SH3 domain-containing protein [Gemmataceae bacterium]